MNRKTAAMALLLASLAACGTTPIEDHHYSLVLDAAKTGAVEINNDADIAVSLARVRIPEFLESRSMAMQTGSNKIQVARHHFWAERLDEAIEKVLLRDIAASTDSVRIDLNQAGADCELRVEFDRFHASNENRVLVSGRYWLSSDGTSRKAEFDLPEPLSGGGHAAAVSALRAALGSLATEIAATIEGSTVCQEPPG